MTSCILLGSCPRTRGHWDFAAWAAAISARSSNFSASLDEKRKAPDTADVGAARRLESDESSREVIVQRLQVSETLAQVRA